MDAARKQKTKDLPKEQKRNSAVGFWTWSNRKRCGRLMRDRVFPGGREQATAILSQGKSNI